MDKSRAAELLSLRSVCSMDCVPVTAYSSCTRCGGMVVQCLTHGWKLVCPCEQEYVAAMVADYDAYCREIGETRDAIVDLIAMGI